MSASFKEAVSHPSLIVSGFWYVYSRSGRPLLVALGYHWAQAVVRNIKNKDNRKYLHEMLAHLMIINPFRVTNQRDVIF